MPTKNPWGKTRDKSNPYAVFRADGWTWSVLKSYQIDNAKPYARWFCFVTSPIVPEGEYGDTYVRDIPGALNAPHAGYSDALGGGRLDV